MSSTAHEVSMFDCILNKLEVQIQTTMVSKMAFYCILKVETRRSWQCRNSQKGVCAGGL